MRWKVTLIGGLAGAAGVVGAAFHYLPLPPWANGAVAGGLVAGGLAILLL